jgi:hypothetical protein
LILPSKTADGMMLMKEKILNQCLSAFDTYSKAFLKHFKPKTPSREDMFKMDLKPMVNLILILLTVRTSSMPFSSSILETLLNSLNCVLI